VFDFQGSEQKKTANIPISVFSSEEKNHVFDFQGWDKTIQWTCERYEGTETTLFSATKELVFFNHA